MLNSVGFGFKRGKVKILFGFIDVDLGVWLWWTGRRQQLWWWYICRLVVVGVSWRKIEKMSTDSRSRSRSRSRSPLDRKIRTQRYSYRDAPYRRESRRGFRFSSFLTIYIMLKFLIVQMCMSKF